MTYSQSLSEAMINDDNDTIRWQNLPHCMTDWSGKIKLYMSEVYFITHLDGHVIEGQFWYYAFSFYQDPRFVVPVSKKTTAFEMQPSKN